MPCFGIFMEALLSDQFLLAQKCSNRPIENVGMLFGLSSQILVENEKRIWLCNSANKKSNRDVMMPPIICNLRVTEFGIVACKFSGSCWV